MLCAGVVARFIFFDLRGRVLGASAVDVMQLDPTMSKHALRFGEGCVNLCCSVHAHVPCMYITKRSCHGLPNMLVILHNPTLYKEAARIKNDIT